MRQGTMIAIKTSIVTGEILGVRIKGTKEFSGKVVDVQLSQLLGILNKMPDAIDNLRLNSSKENGLEFINGAQSRYADLSNDGTDAAMPLVILNKVEFYNEGKVAYELCRYTGETLLADGEWAVSFARNNSGIANGKIVDRNGKSIISSIQGEYPVRKATEHDESSEVYSPKKERQRARDVSVLVRKEQEELAKKLERACTISEGTEKLSLRHHKDKDWTDVYTDIMASYLESKNIPYTRDIINLTVIGRGKDCKGIKVINVATARDNIENNHTAFGCCDVYMQDPISEKTKPALLYIMIHYINGGRSIQLKRALSNNDNMFNENHVCTTRGIEEVKKEALTHLLTYFNADTIRNIENKQSQSNGSKLVSDIKAKGSILKSIFNIDKEAKSFIKGRNS